MESSGNTTATNYIFYFNTNSATGSDLDFWKIGADNSYLAGTSKGAIGRAEWGALSAEEQYDILCACFGCMSQAMREWETRTKALIDAVEELQKQVGAFHR